jgi:hypothetical protein
MQILKKGSPKEANAQLLTLQEKRVPATATSYNVYGKYA